MTPLPASNAPKLDARLAAAAAYVRRGGTAADIGCDHGKLTAFLAANGICKKVIASDLRPAPLARARALVESCGCADAVELRLGDGLCVLRPGEAEDLILAGLSGVTIGEILSAAPDGFFAATPDVRLILTPASKHAHLRRFLCENGFALLDETPCRAAGRYYTVMHAAYTGQPTAPDAYFCAAGLCAKGPDGAGYLRHTAACLEKELRGAPAAQQPALRALAGRLRLAAASLVHT